MAIIRGNRGSEPTVEIRGVQIFKEMLSPNEQQQILDDARHLVREAPLFRPETRFGKKMSVQMTSAGRLGWVSDRRGYRYEPTHPLGMVWPKLPESVCTVWRMATGLDRMPDCCLVNHYSEGSRMGLHQDRDEGDFSWPVVSISLGDEALFRVGNVERGGPTESIWLQSGDVAVMAGPARLIHHGIDKIRFGSSALLKGGGRINLTLRVVA